MTQAISTGRIVHYVLSERDVQQIVRRRTTGHSIAERIGEEKWPLGAQAHIGNPPAEGDIVPLLVVRVWGDQSGEGHDLVNGQAFLDGNDVLWVTSKGESPDPFPGCWHWPERV